MMGFSCFGVLARNGGRSIHSPDHQIQDITLDNVRLFSYRELKSATRNFHPSNQLGRGGFGIVYKGVLRDETPVAVKTLSVESNQGAREFLTEINTISNIRHQNLVQLIGCCIEGRDRMLVYEYLENNSLTRVLLGPRSKRSDLDWSKRVTICLGTAQGLAFLHEETKPHIVHRDIKASNILLDRDLNPKIGDFGLAKLFPDNVTHVSTRVAGTIGYLAPEYALLGQLTRKADIYSFGVLILEIISGRSSSNSAWGEDMMLLLEWTWKLRHEDRLLLEIVDPELVEYPEDEVLRFIKIALICTQGASHHRPSMKQVARMLSKEVELDLDVKVLTQPEVYKSHSNENTSSSRGRESPYSSRGKKSVLRFMSPSQVMKSFVTQLQPR